MRVDFQLIQMANISIDHDKAMGVNTINVHLIQNEHIQANTQ